VHAGYVVADVDEYLDALEERALLAQGLTAGRRGKADPGSEAEFLKGELAGAYMRRFPRAGSLRRGYHPDDVDEFVDRVVATLDGQDAVTVEQVRTAPFRPRRGGYREDAVDEAMDRVVEHLMEVRRPSDAPRTPPLPRPAD
jgi:DivIVA domain-containing protein